jgi:hypothetical protein
MKLSTLALLCGGTVGLLTGLALMRAPETESVSSANRPDASSENQAPAESIANADTRVDWIALAQGHFADASEDVRIESITAHEAGAEVRLADLPALVAPIWCANQPARIDVWAADEHDLFVFCTDESGDDVVVVMSPSSEQELPTWLRGGHGGREGEE